MTKERSSDTLGNALIVAGVSMVTVKIREKIGVYLPTWVVAGLVGAIGTVLSAKCTPIVLDHVAPMLRTGMSELRGMLRRDRSRRDLTILRIE